MVKRKHLLIGLAVLFVVYLSVFGLGSTINKDYSISPQPDGGYLLNVTTQKLHWQLITPEGTFPKETLHFKISLSGKGRDWSYRNQKGYYYSIEDIKTNMHHWDLGYAWIDAENKYLHLNLFWVHSPDGVIASDVNGKYSITP